jgi:hypothetical protein
MANAVMRIPQTAIIAADKLSKYLLIPRPWDDKSKYLAQAGFHLAEPHHLEGAIRGMIGQYDAVENGSNDYGTFYRVAGELVGPTGVSLPVVLIWLQWKMDSTFHFVTLKPTREQA